MTLIEPSELRWREPPAVVSLGPCDSARVRSSIPKVNHVPSSCCWRQVAMEDLPELDAPFNTMSLAFTQPRVPVITHEERGARSEERGARRVCPPSGVRGQPLCNAKRPRRSGFASPNGVECYAESVRGRSRLRSRSGFPPEPAGPRCLLNARCGQGRMERRSGC